MADGIEGGEGTSAFGRHLVDFFTRIAAGDFSARIPRNFKRDHEDAIAFMVEVVAEQLAKKQESQTQHDAALAVLIEKFIALAAGDFSVRAERTHRGDTLDTFAYLLNNVSAELGELVADHDHQRMLLETVLESMVDGVLLLDSNGKVRRSNAAMAAMLGADASLVGVDIAQVLAKTENALAMQLAQMRAHDVFRERATFFVGPNGDRLPLTVSASAHRNVHGELVGVVLVARDERELQKARMHLQRTERLTTMGTLAAGVAHEINNPLAFISANLDFAIEELEKLTPSNAGGDRLNEVTRALSASRTGAERVRHIVKDLRTFARSDAEALSRVNLNDVCELALGLAANEVRNRARVVKEYGAPPPVLGNEGRLVQVVVNLIQNGAQSITAGSRKTNEIRLVTGEDAGQAFVDVQDTGCGIAEDELPRIFDLFYTTKPVGVGMGLGLSISLRLAQAMGGQLEVESQLGEGSRFRLLLPAAADEPLPPAPRNTGRHRVT